MKSWTAIALGCCLPWAALGCSDDSGEGTGGGDGVARDDVLEVTLNGQALPLEADPTTFSVVLSDQVNAGFASDMPAFGEMAAGTFGISVTINDTEATGVYPLIPNMFDLDDTSDPAGHISVTPTDLTFFDSIDGEVTVETLSLGTPADNGAPRLGTFAGTFSGTFDDGEGNQLEASGRFGYY